MSHTYLALDMSLIPTETKQNVPTFWMARFSNDGIYNEDGSFLVEPTRILIDGYNKDRNLVHPDSTFLKWLQWSEDPQSMKQFILDNAEEYTREEFQEQVSNPLSIWFTPEDDL